MTALPRPELFHLPPAVTYLDGHSLGPLPCAAAARLRDVVDREWGRGLVRSWNDADWIGAGERIGGKIAGLIGAQPHEVLVADSTTVNLYKLAAAALLARPERPVVLSEPGNFPTDVYALEGVVRSLGGRELQLHPLIPAKAGTHHPPVQDQTPPGAANAKDWQQGTDPAMGPGLRRDVRSLLNSIDERTALVVLTHVHYKSAEVRDMAAITAAAHDVGAWMLWDLSHSTGAVEVDLNEAGVDLAVGCGYKYLNGGPGAPAFLFVSERLQDQLASPLSGWMGHAAPFAFEDGYRPAPGVARFACGTPPILSLSALEVGVDLALAAGAPALAAQARALGDAFIAAVEGGPAGRELTLLSPRGGRGGHVAYTHAEGYAVMQALIARGVLGDFREPDVLRFGFSPQFLGLDDARRAADTLHEIMETRAWVDPAYAVRARVT